jgi:hypothetical protein
MSLSPRKRVHFGELHVREFDRATMGEHPLARSGRVLQLGHRYRDLPPVAIPNEQPQKRGAVRVSPRRRKAFWIKQWRLEQALLNPRLILGGGQKHSMDEQRLFELERRHQKPLMERFKEQCRRDREDKLEKKLEKRDRHALQERKRIRRENRRNHCRRVLQAQQAAREEQIQNERRRLLQLAEQQAREDQRRVRREIRENERRRQLQVEAANEEIELEREPRDSIRVLAAPDTTNHSLSDAADLCYFLWIALELVFISVLMVVVLVVLCLLDTLLGLSSCQTCFATLSSNGCIEQYRANLSFCVRCCKRDEKYCACVCGIVALFLCIREFAACC